MISKLFSWLNGSVWRNARNALRALCPAFALLLPAMGHAGEPAAASTRPNVVFLIVDDLDVAVYQSGLDAGLYPNLKNLIAAGTHFTNSFVTLSICCPSRATFLTGQYGHNHGTVRNTGKKGGFPSFKDSSTLPVWLKAGGYRTALMGKYLNGYNGDDALYVPPGWDTWNALLSLHQYNYTLSMNGTPRVHGEAESDYQTDVLSGLADAFIRVPGSQPFFLALTPSSPHLESGGEINEDDGGDSLRPAPRHVGTPTVPLPALGLPSFNEADMSDKPTWVANRPKVVPALQERVFNEKRTAMRAVDDMVGRLVQTLKDTGKWNNTLFVFTSDNGFQYGTHRRKLTKVDVYEESIRVPLVVKAPGQTTGRVTDAWAVNNDWAVTVMDYAGLQPEASHVFDGRSLKPLVLGPTTGAGRRSTLVELPPIGQNTGHPPFFAIRSKDPRLTLDPTGQRVLVYTETLNVAGNAVTGQELYDLDTDPYQVASQHRSTASVRVRQRELLKARLDALKRCVGTACQSLEN